MDYEVFKDYYLSASIHFIWEYRVVEDYLPVIDKAIQDTFNWFEIAEIQLINKDLGGAILPANKHHEKRFALFMNNCRTKSVGSTYSIFKENFSVITRGYDDLAGIPFPPISLEGCKSLFVSLDKSEEGAQSLWDFTQSLKRRITRFETLADKSINRQRKVPPKLRLQVLARDGFRCIFCGRTSKETSLHVDHITPVTRGGRNELDFLATLCQECNLGKGAQNIENIFSPRSC